jgi:hypothetical protein
MSVDHHASIAFFISGERSVVVGIEKPQNLAVRLLTLMIFEGVYVNAGRVVLAQGCAT